MGESLGRYDIMMLLYHDFKLDYCCHICGHTCIGSKYGIPNLWKALGYSNYYFLYVHVKNNAFSRNLKRTYQLLSWREMDFKSLSRFCRKNIKGLLRRQRYSAAQELITFSLCQHFTVNLHLILPVTITVLGNLGWGIHSELQKASVMEFCTINMI